jgi:hypothetical protein
MKIIIGVVIVALILVIVIPIVTTANKWYLDLLILINYSNFSNLFNILIFSAFDTNKY